MNQQPLTFFCISTYFKGEDFLRQMKANGHRVLLLTRKVLEHEPWPREAIDTMYYLETDSNGPENMKTLELGFAHLLRSERIDRVVALDDFDVEKATFLREHFRLPGMGQTTGRHFRDKLAMRTQARDAGIPIPGFSALFNDEAIRHFTESFPGPWVVKPRGEASATGIKKVHTSEELWEHIRTLGDKRHEYLVEQFKPGDVYHADALSVNGEVLFCRVSKYLSTPFEVAHGGGIFRSQVCEFDGDDDRALQELNRQVMKGFGMRFSASHTEFIRCHEDGKYYFLETSSRVGGAHLAEMVEFSSGINLWAEWANIEHCVATGQAYRLPAVRFDHAGILVSLARYQYPDTSSFNDPEIVWKVKKDFHVGMIVRSNSHERVRQLLDEYAHRVQRDFHAAAPSA